MAASPRSDLWPLRDDRTLSEHAKFAYMLLWLRLPDAHPSMRTLAGDMSVAVSTATKAVRELQAAGLVKVLPRVTAKGDPDSNQFILTPPREAGYPSTPDGGPPPRETEPKMATGSRQVKGENSLASRRARPAVTRDDVISFVRRAITLSYSAAEAEDCTDSQCVALWYSLVSNRRPADPVAYLCKPMADAPYLDTLLANAGDEEDWLLAALAS